MSGWATGEPGPRCGEPPCTAMVERPADFVSFAIRLTDTLSRGIEIRFCDNDSLAYAHAGDVAQLHASFGDPVIDLHDCELVTPRSIDPCQLALLKQTDLCVGRADP